MENKVISIDGRDIPIKLIRSNRAKHMRIAISAVGDIKITLPYFATDAHLHEMLKQKKSWIQQTLNRIAQNPVKPKTIPIFTEQTVFNTHYHKLQIQAKPIAQARLRAANGLISVEYPLSMPVSHPNLQNFIKQGIIETLRIEAKYYLPKRLTQLALLHQFVYKDVFIKNLKSKWGSCSHQNNINLNLHLMRLPEKLIDYVLVHELVHTVVKNHSKEFWNLLQAKMPDAKARHKEIQNYNTDL